MSQPAEAIFGPVSAGASVIYEQPLSERWRTFLRLEILYQQLLYNMEQPSGWASRLAVTNLLDMLAILGRGDTRSDALKELERLLYVYDRFQQLPNVDENRLHGVLRNLKSLRGELQSVGPQYLLPVRESEFLNAIKHRSAIPGGTCEFDLPEYSHWLRQPVAGRKADFARWTKFVRPLCDSIAELLWLLRQGGESVSVVAANGVYQHNFTRGQTIVLLRICLPGDTRFYPEVSASQHRFTVRFMERPDVHKRAKQTAHDVSFDLRLC